MGRPMACVEFASMAGSVIVMLVVCSKIPLDGQYKGG
jgi:hypothetical protein